MVIIEKHDILFLQSIILFLFFMQLEIKTVKKTLLKYLLILIKDKRYTHF